MLSQAEDTERHTSRGLMCIEKRWRRSDCVNVRMKRCSVPSLGASLAEVVKALKSPAIRNIPTNTDLHISRFIEMKTLQHMD